MTLFDISSIKITLTRKISGMAIMSKEEVALISDSWNLVAVDVAGNGCKFFV